MVACLIFAKSIKVLMLKFGVIAVQLPTGVHAKHVEQKQRSIKDKMRACTFCLPWAVPMSMVPHLVFDEHFSINDFLPWHM